MMTTAEKLATEKYKHSHSYGWLRKQHLSGMRLPRGEVGRQADGVEQKIDSRHRQVPLDECVVMLLVLTGT